MDGIFQTIRAEEFGGWLNAAVFVAVLAVMVAVTIVNSAFQAWLRGRWPALFGRRATPISLAVLALWAVGIAIMLAVTPRSEIRKMFPQLTAPVVPSMPPTAPVPYLPNSN